MVVSPESCLLLAVRLLLKEVGPLFIGPLSFPPAKQIQYKTLTLYFLLDIWLIGKEYLPLQQQIPPRFP